MSFVSNTCHVVDVGGEGEASNEGAQIGHVFLKLWRISGGLLVNWLQHDLVD